MTTDIVVCVGPGGVGKTTMAAALAVSAARSGRRVVLITVDPARRLADALGLASEASDPDSADRADERRLGGSGALGNEPRRLPLDDTGTETGTGELWASMLDVRATFDGLIREHATDDAQARRVLDNRLYDDLTTSLSGTHEYMAAERLRALHVDDRFDLVVVDTPPSRHALDLLDAPGRLARFVDHRLYRSLLAPRKGVMRVVSAATQALARAIGQLVGTTMLTDVTEFFAAFEGMDQGFRDRAAEIDALLAGPTTRYVAVTAPAAQTVDETGWLVAELAGRGRRVDLVVANRVLPDFGWRPEPARTPDPLDVNLADLATRRDAQLGELGALAGDGSRPLIQVEERAEPVTDADALAALSTQLDEAWNRLG
ncbi:MAG: ArsA family ATPase [Acidimicrobiales bacterium]